ncbi:Glycosyltransferase [Sphingobacterium faecium PCAi_F2.5]|nr:Glycosyltransferase [Sphingobacterium faecium PCAi_F2.5]
MKIAYCIRRDYEIRGGGDAVQMLMTKKYLEKYYSDTEIVIVTDKKELNKSFDLCHIFNYSTFDETNNYFLKARELDIKIASSPIYWDYSITAYQYFSKLKLFNVNRKILNIEIYILKFLQIFFPIFMLTSNKFRNYCEFFLENSDIVLPNSAEEYELLLKFVNRANFNKSTHSVIYNATEINEIMDSSNFLNKYNLPENYLLQVGRIEPIKNQLSVLKSLKDNKDIPIVFLGKVFDDNYFKKLKKLSLKRGNVFFIQEVPYKDVFEFYKNARTHILPSLRESPGLVSLEAYSQGCNIICAQFPYSPYLTYFKDIAISIDPLNLDSIKSAVLHSFSIGKSESNFDILKKFSWDNTARDTYEAYKKIIFK